MGQPLPTLECCHEKEGLDTELHIAQIGHAASVPSTFVPGGQRHELNDEGLGSGWAEVQPCNAGLASCMSQPNSFQDTSCNTPSMKVISDANRPGGGGGAGAYAEPGTPCGGERSLESLSYLPVRFDEPETYDVDRSRERYSKVLVHGTRARTQRGAKWDAWLRSAALGRSVTLLGLDEEDGVASSAAPDVRRASATYCIDAPLTRLSVLPIPQEAATIDGAQIPIRKIQSVCAATDIMMMWNKMESVLTESEKVRAIILQYIDEDEASGASAKRRVCFLEQTALAKEQFVEAVTALWLEKRNDHSMWF